MGRPFAFICIVLGSVAVAAMGRVAGGLGVEPLELRTLEWRQRASATSRASDSAEVVLVLFDSTTVREWPYLSPFPRPFLADLIDALSAAGARTIGLDVYLEDLFPELNAREGGDDRLAEAITNAGNVVLVAPTEMTPGGPRIKEPHPAFADPAADIGAADLPTPFESVQDGVLAVRSDGRLEPSFALAVWAHARGLDVDSILDEAEASGVLGLPGLSPRVGRIPESWSESRNSGGDFALTFPLRYIGPPSRTDAPEGQVTFRAYAGSFAATVAAFTPELFRDRIVLLGTGFHDSDRFRTPFYEETRPAPPGEEAEGAAELWGWMYGVEIHANAIQNLLEASWVRPLSRAGTGLWMVLLATIPTAIVFWKGTMWGAFAMVGAALLAVAGGFWGWLGQVVLPGLAFEIGGGWLWVPIVAPLIGVVVSYLGSTAYVAIVEGREKRFIRGAFGKYVSPEVVADIAENPDALRLGGQKRPLTILFSDLAGFTSLSESLSPERLIALLNEYLSEMTRLVMDEEGTLDKYIGDAIMAFWNAPRTQEDHADHALRCAIRMQRRMDELNRKWLDEGVQHEPFIVRIGINTGEAVVGNVGGQERFDYSAIGDPVNLAARLEPANKSYGTLVMTSELTLAEADREAYRLRELDFIAVKGRNQPVRVYEVVGFAHEALDEARQRVLERYTKGLERYRARDWSGAAELFEEALGVDPGDGPSGVYAERCREFADDPPPEDWDFVVRRTVK